MNTHISTFSNNIVTYEILGGLQVQLNIQENPYQIPLENLFLMAARMNKKRSFLFVSKVLGKHIPILPVKGIQVGYLLAARYMELVNETFPSDLDTLVYLFKNDLVLNAEAFIDEQYEPIIIGFAETATALGHSFFEAFRHADFFHTTRESFPDVVPTITFEEEHSHATSHRVYVDQCLLESDREIILVDDELTTGKTALNIIRSIHEKFPRKKYTIVSILDWRSDENIHHFRELEKELGITILTVSLVKGTVSVIGQADLAEIIYEATVNREQKVSFHTISNPSPISLGASKHYPYTRFTGRFGLNTFENQEAAVWMEKVGRELGKLRSGKRSLVLGTGEFMYIPMKVASFMGEDVFYHSTTRSPIYPVKKANYGVQNRYHFPNPEDVSIQQYVYNIDENEYDDLFIFFERKVEEPQLQEMLQELRKANIAEIKIVYLCEKEGELSL